MTTLLDQIEQSLTAKSYLLALIASLTVPDIAGALDSEDGHASGEKYRAWYEVWARPVSAENIRAGLPPDVRDRISVPENPLTGDACFRFRCSLLHQGSSQHPQSPFSKIMFIEPGSTSNSIHYCQVNDALVIDLPQFCGEIVLAARRWLKAVESTPRFQANYSRFARRHPTGLVPYIGGVPVIG